MGFKIVDQRMSQVILGFSSPSLTRTLTWLNGAGQESLQFRPPVSLGPFRCCSFKMCVALGFMGSESGDYAFVHVDLSISQLAVYGKSAVLAHPFSFAFGVFF